MPRLTKEKPLLPVPKLFPASNASEPAAESAPGGFALGMGTAGSCRPRRSQGGRNTHSAAIRSHENGETSSCVVGLGVFMRNLIGS